jgi:hypothetical protein
MENIFRQRVVKRRFFTYLAPWILLVLILMNLTWDIFKINIAHNLRTAWPWRVNALDVATCATLAGILAGLLVTRSQLSRTMRPAVSWRTTDAQSGQINRAARTVHVYNAGGGRAVIDQVKYRISARNPNDSSSGSDWARWEDAIRQIELLGLKHRKDFYILHLGAGASVPGSDSVGIELAAFTKKAYSRLSRVDVLIQFDDIVGDTYEIVIACLSILSALRSVAGN